MVWLMGLSSLAVSLYVVLAVHPFENAVVNTLCFIVFSVAYSVLLCVASDFEDKMNKRIKALENELENKEKTV